MQHDNVTKFPSHLARKPIKVHPSLEEKPYVTFVCQKTGQTISWHRPKQRTHFPAPPSAWDRIKTELRDWPILVVGVLALSAFFVAVIGAVILAAAFFDKL